MADNRPSDQLTPGELESLLASIGTANRPTLTCAYLLAQLPDGTSHDRELFWLHAQACEYCALELASQMPIDEVDDSP